MKANLWRNSKHKVAAINGDREGVEGKGGGAREGRRMGRDGCKMDECMDDGWKRDTGEEEGGAWMPLGWAVYSILPTFYIPLWLPHLFVI